MRIGAHIAAYQQFLLTHLARSDDAALNNAVRLATGQRINKPADDPAAFVQLSSFQDRAEVVKETKTQVEVAASVGAESQLALDQVRTQLDAIREALLLDEESELTGEERTTQQATIDTAIETIEELVGTEIHGRRLLDGSANYRFAGKDHTELRDIEVYALKETEFSGTVSSAATQAEVRYTGPGQKISDDATFTLTGQRGSATITVEQNESLSDAADRINQVSHKTGITASVQGNQLDLTSVDYGEEATIDIDVTSGSFETTGDTQGSDAVITINGISISSSSIDGNRASYTHNGTHVVFEFQPEFSGDFSTVTVSDEDVLEFALSTNLARKTRLAVPSVDPSLLGGLSGRLSDLKSGGALEGLESNTSQAIRVVDEALGQLTRVEGRVDAFADVAVASASSLLDGLSETLDETIEQINGVDEEAENLLLSRNQALSSNAQAALSVLQQQQANLLALVQNAAGM